MYSKELFTCDFKWQIVKQIYSWIDVPLDSQKKSFNDKTAAPKTVWEAVWSFKRWERVMYEMEQNQSRWDR